ncbi:Nephrocystin-1 [Sparganum proliferum]
MVSRGKTPFELSDSMVIKHSGVQEIQQKENIKTEDARTQLENLDSQLGILLKHAQSLDKKKEEKPVSMFDSKKQRLLTNLDKEKINLARCHRIIEADTGNSTEGNKDGKLKSLLAKVLSRGSRRSSTIKVVEEKLAETSPPVVAPEKQEQTDDYDELAEIPLEGFTLEAIEKSKKNTPKKTIPADRQRDILVLVDELERSFESTSTTELKPNGNAMQKNGLNNPAEDEDNGDASQADTVLSTDADSEYEVVQHWSSQEEGDLSINTGEMVHVFKKRDDGWWSAVNRNGKQGLVPSNFLAPAKKITSASDAKTLSAKPLGVSVGEHSQSDVSEVEEVFSEEEEAAVAEEPAALPLRTVAGKDGDGEDAGSEDIGGGGDSRGVDVPFAEPASFSLLNKEKPRKRSSLAKSEPAQKKTMMASLTSVDSLPLGLHASTLKQWETYQYSLGYWLQPQLDSSGLRLADLTFDASASKVVPRPGQWQRIITIQKVANLPSLPQTDLMEVRKCVRLCLYDGRTVISNIYQMALSSSDKGSVYSVNPLIIDPTQKSAEFSDVFVRRNSADRDFSILFEVAATVRKLNSEETIEVGCGWATIPAYQEDGNPIQNKVFELELTPGAPMEKRTRFSTDLPRFASASRRASSQLPKVVVRLAAPNKRQIGYLDCLPDTLIGGCAYLPLLVFYRELMAEELTTNRASSVAVIRHLPPVLANFPDVVNCPLLLEALRVTWNTREKSAASSFRRNSVVARRTFSSHFLRAVFPLTSVYGLIPENSDQPEVFAKAAKSVLELARQCEKDPLSVLLSDTWDQKPLKETQLVLSIRAH